MLSRICEEGLAENLLAAMQQPLDLALRVMELRAYAGAKHALVNAKKKEEIPNSPMVLTVMEIQAELLETLGKLKPGGPKKYVQKQRGKDEARGFGKKKD